MATNLQFLIEEQWTAQSVADWIIRGCLSGDLTPLDYSQRLHPYISTCLAGMSDNSPVEAKNILRDGVVIALNGWESALGLRVAEELAYLAGYLRAVETLQKMRSFFTDYRLTRQFSAESLYGLRGNILQYIRKVTHLGDQGSYLFFLFLYEDPSIDIRFMSQIILGLLKSRPYDLDYKYLDEYISRFLEITWKYPDLFSENSRVKFFEKVCKLLLPRHLFEIIGVRSNTIVLDYCFVNSNSYYRLKITGDSSVEVVVRNERNSHPVAGINVSDKVSDNEKVNRHIQVESAKEESARFSQDAVGTLEDDMHW